MILPSVCGDGVCVDVENGDALYQCVCFDGFVFSEEIGLCVGKLVHKPRLANSFV